MPEITDGVAHTWPVRVVEALFMVCVWLSFADWYLGPHILAGYTTPQEDAVSCYPKSEQAAMLAAVRKDDVRRDAPNGFTYGDRLFMRLGGIAIFGFLAFFWSPVLCRVGEAPRRALGSLVYFVPAAMAVWLLRDIWVPIILLPLCIGMMIFSRLFSRH
jgi:hypothetical protein